MKQFTISIPDSKASMFFELMKSLSFVKKVEEVIDIPEEHKKIVLERIKKYENNPDAYLDWEDVEKELNIE